MSAMGSSFFTGWTVVCVAFLRNDSSTAMTSTDDRTLTCLTSGAALAGFTVWLKSISGSGDGEAAGAAVANGSGSGGAASTSGVTLSGAGGGGAGSAVKSAIGASAMMCCGSAAVLASIGSKAGAAGASSTSSDCPISSISSSMIGVTMEGVGAGETNVGGVSRIAGMGAVFTFRAPVCVWG